MPKKYFKISEKFMERSAFVNKKKNSHKFSHFKAHKPLIILWTKQTQKKLDKNKVVSIPFELYIFAFKPLENCKTIHPDSNSLDALLRIKIKGFREYKISRLSVGTCPTFAHKSWRKKLGK